ncbi:hypothetical protein ASN18_3237 [Candidatus Magnetominusculus xianensis]|uniref:Uncharacterized protein n=1 Tax=Candidatus Magnetominusculus xianensis TaxID=1748249 RepID=A0ABR5SB21_9BACT|nr:hypothetical protein ASN18_3237 [Candidatus Magnetominusculus xianensis]
MTNMKPVCLQCNCALPKDHFALNRKLLGRRTKNLFCIKCLAVYLDCTEEDLLVKIEEFKEQGCQLF